MDNLTRAFYMERFRAEYLQKKGTAFQDFFSDIMEKAYPGDFVRVRPWGNVGDKKNDGYLGSARVLFQVYAPNEMTSAEAVKKIDEDFNGALPHWKKYFDNWVFVHNSQQGLGPDVLQKLLDLKAAHGSKISVSHWGMEELRQEVFGLLSDETLASLLGPAPTKTAMLNLGLEELAPVLDQIAVLPARGEPDLRPPPSDKIQRNMLSDSVSELLRIGMTRAPLVRQYFDLTPAKHDKVAASFHQYYEEHKSEMGPDEMFSSLQRYAGGDNTPSPSKQCAILAVLAFFFEECEIFEREVGG
jgi:hypothetical protein